jgi:hypothetical protein
VPLSADLRGSAVDLRRLKRHTCCLLDDGMVVDGLQIDY